MNPFAVAIWSVVLALVLVHALWLHYVAIMRLKMVRDAGKLTPAAKVFGYPALFVGLLLDLIVNTFVGSIVFAEMPREWTLSARLTRLSGGEPGWRQKRAERIRMALLDDIDPSGIHKG